MTIKRRTRSRRSRWQSKDRHRTRSWIHGCLRALRLSFIPLLRHPNRISVIRSVLGKIIDGKMILFSIILPSIILPHPHSFGLFRSVQTSCDFREVKQHPATPRVDRVACQVLTDVPIDRPVIDQQGLALFRYTHSCPQIGQ